MGGVVLSFCLAFGERSYSLTGRHWEKIWNDLVEGKNMIKIDFCFN